MPSKDAVWLLVVNKDMFSIPYSAVFERLAGFADPAEAAHGGVHRFLAQVVSLVRDDETDFPRLGVDHPEN